MGSIVDTLQPWLAPFATGPGALLGTGAKGKEPAGQSHPASGILQEKEDSAPATEVLGNFSS